MTKSVTKMEPITILREKDFAFFVNMHWILHKTHSKLEADQIFFHFDSMLKSLFKVYEFQFKYDVLNDRWALKPKDEQREN